MNPLWIWANTFFRFGLEKCVLERSYQIVTAGRFGLFAAPCILALPHHVDNLMTQYAHLFSDVSAKFE